MEAIIQTQSVSTIVISLATMSAFFSFTHSKTDRLHFHLMNVQGESSSHDCGVFSIAHATELAYRCDWVASCWDNETIRPHRHRWKWPTSQIPQNFLLEYKYTSSSLKTYSVYTGCQMTKMMMKCDRCLKWYHYDCMSLNEDKSCKHKKQVCTLCLDFVQSVT